MACDECKPELSKPVGYDPNAKATCQCEYYEKREVEEILSKTKEIKLIGLAVTDDRKNDIKKISTFSAEYKNNIFFTIDINPVLDAVNCFLNEEDYLNIFAKKINEYKNMVNEVDKVSNEINNMLRGIDASNRPIVLSGGIISLFTSDDNNFKDNFDNLDKENLFKDFFNSIRENLKNVKIFEDKLETTLDRFNTLKACKHELLENGLLARILSKLNAKILPILIKYKDYDVMGLFYKRFLKYAGITDVKKGIILTPEHIAELFCELADLHPSDVVLDSCCGSGTFLIKAMKYMIDKSDKLPDTVTSIKKNNLIGIENHSGMFTLSLANMMFHGDGKAQIHFGDCFKKIDEIKKSDNNRPTVGFINPPYGGSDSEKNPIKKEIRFIKKMLEIVKKKLVVIAPISVFIQDSNLRKEILERHTLKAVISMPDDLFMPNASVKTAIAVFDANTPHKQKNVLFYNLKEDGYSVQKNKGRIDIFGRWDSIKKKLLNVFKKMDEKTKTVSGIANIVNDKSYFKSYIKKYLEYQIKLNNELLDKDLDFITLFEIASNEMDMSNLLEESNEEIPLETCQDFLLKDIFNVLNKPNKKVKGKKEEKTDPAPNISNQEIYLENFYGRILLVGAKNNNNGVVKITSKEEEVREYKNCITLNKTGNGGAGLVSKEQELIASLQERVRELENEREEFTRGGIKILFSGKANAQQVARKVKPRTLKEVPELSIGSEEEKSKNLYHGKVDLILTDPPYNTGKDFRYNDKWDEDPNDEGLGDYMLKPSGVLAICIDYREISRLTCLLNEIFGEKNRLGIISWQKATVNSMVEHISVCTEFILIYTKDKKNAKTNLLPKSAEDFNVYKNPDNDPLGSWVVGNPTAPKT
ncbi:10897_t:CDS:2 [Ambispora leptoticha]|uniref:site-specific DNA-methyltransferase (adenine-specific) n=1 Tax=Ambispora leptoticha TaxID=144679 RepID=A0A9N9ADL9_9GLOM|nr:10897_t:CDS:2 [Ambispora leptoticha]